MSSFHIRQACFRYRLFGDAAGGRVQADRITKCFCNGGIRDGIENAASLLASGDGVCVIRRLSTRLLLGSPARQTDLQLQRVLEAHLAKATEDCITRADPGNVIIFESRAAFIAAFFKALLEGRAWNTWIFGSFMKYKSVTIGETAGRVLLDYSHLFPRIVRAFTGPGEGANRLCLELSSEDAVTLWRHQLGETGSRGGEQDTDPVPADVHALWKLILDLGVHLVPNGADQLAALEGFRGQCGDGIDWNDRRALAALVFQGIQLLYDPRGCSEVRLPEAWDWLDREWLAARLQTWREERRDGPQERTAEGLLSTDKHRESALGTSFTPRQQELLADLRQACRNARTGLGQPRPERADFQIRLFAALVVVSDRWEGDPLAAGMIQRLGRSILALSGDDRVACEEAERFLQAVVELAPEFETFWEQRSAAQSNEDERKPRGLRTGVGRREEYYSPVAGTLLLLRAANDLGLARLAHASLGQSEQSREMLLIASALRMGGRGSLSASGEVDPALRCFAGMEDPVFLTDLKSWWSRLKDERLLSFQTNLLGILLQRHEIDRSGFCVHCAPMPELGQAAVLVGDVCGRHWVRGELPGSSVDLAERLQFWRNEWTTLGGESSPAMTISTGRETDEEARQRQEGLEAALASLAGPSLGMPLVDLSIALAANSALRLWAKWLRGFEDTTTPYLLREWVRRGGWISEGPVRFAVRLERRPLDIVLERAGYFGTLDHVPWFRGKRVTFSREN